MNKVFKKVSKKTTLPETDLYGIVFASVVSLLILALGIILCGVEPRKITTKKIQYNGHDYIEFYQRGRCVSIEHSMECKKCYDFFD